MKIGYARVSTADQNLDFRQEYRQTRTKKSFGDSS